MKIITIFGTRPEIIKLSPLIPLLDEQVEHVMIHTGQHYSKNMDEIFFKELELRNPDYHLKVGSGTQNYQLETMRSKIEEILLKEKPDWVLVQGDTNSTLAGALAASKLGLKVAHLEAGCRSGNLEMAEEMNRILTDHCSTLLLTPDKLSKDNLIAEHIEKEKIHTVGDTIVDASLRAKKIAEKMPKEKDEYILVTLHRAENTDNREILREIIEALNSLSQKIIFPIHPRTKKKLEEFDLKLQNNIKLREPEGYVSFVNLLMNAKLVLTDSGGIQRESALLDIPCLVIRNETEYQELVDLGKIKLIGTKKESIIKEANDNRSLQDMKNINYKCPTGATNKTVELLK